MAYDIEPIHSERGRIVKALFIDTADDNYITARWCFVERLNVDYFWLAVHALEKYMKAALLLNGQSSRNYRDGRKCQSFGHDIVALHECVKRFAADLLPQNLEQPDELDTRRWGAETPEVFLDRLYRNGNADNRYQIFGFVQRPEDLYKLDAMVFALRRLCVPLDAYFLGKRRPNKANPTHRDLLAKQPECWHICLSGKLEMTANGKRGERLREVLLNLNVHFAPENFSHGSLRTGTSARHPILGRAILAPLEQAPDSEAAALAAEVCDWTLANIQLPKDVIQQLRNARAKPRP